jgi:preprotein translocase subunit SecY
MLELHLCITKFNNKISSRKKTKFELGKIKNVKINKEIRNIILKAFISNVWNNIIYSIGTFLPVPGINHSDLAFYLQSHSVTKNLVSTFSGDDTFVIGLFTLNIFPYINASILVQLILGFSPN